MSNKELCTPGTTFKYKDTGILFTFKRHKNPLRIYAGWGAEQTSYLKKDCELYIKVKTWVIIKHVTNVYKIY